MKFLENRGSFELKLSLWNVINSINGIKICNFYFKNLYSPILASLEPSQTDETEIGRKLIP
jgi:hypothetical protein